MLEHLLHEPDALALLLLLLLCTTTTIWGRSKKTKKTPAGRRTTNTEKNGPDKAAEVNTWPHLLRLELVAALVVLLVLCWWAMALEPPLGRVACPEVTPRLAKAPWFFVGIQEMLQYFDSWLAGAVLPLAMLVGLCLLPYLHQGRDRRIPALVTTLIALLWLLPMVVGQFFRGAHWALRPVWWPPSTEAPAGAGIASLGQALGLQSGGASVLGGVLCLLPLALAPLAWVRLRARAPLARAGIGRFVICSVLLWALAGIGLKVVLSGLDIRYLWVTPWFRI